MQVKVVGRESLERSFDGKRTVKEVMESMSLRADHYVTLLNGSPVAEDETAQDPDELVFLEIFSGG